MHSCKGTHICVYIYVHSPPHLKSPQDLFGIGRPHWLQPASAPLVQLRAPEGSHFWHQSQLQWGPAARQQTSAHSLSTYRGFGERETEVSEDCTSPTVLSWCTDSLCSYWQPQLTKTCTINTFQLKPAASEVHGILHDMEVIHGYAYICTSKQANAVLRTGELSVLHIPTHVVDVLI